MHLAIVENQITIKPIFIGSGISVSELLQTEILNHTTQNAYTLQSETLSGRYPL